MWGKGPPQDNLESWRDIQQFIAEFPDDAYWLKWKPMVRKVVAELEAKGLAGSLRIGQSMHHIIFSTLEKHRLMSEPRVTMDVHPKEQTVRVAYSCANLWFSEPTSQESVLFSSATPTMLKYLRRLWTETKPNSPIPDALKAV